MKIFSEPIKRNDDTMHISDLKWNTGLADIILKGLQELNQDIGNINDNFKNGSYQARNKRYL